MPQSLRESKYQSRPLKWMSSLITGLLFALPFIVVSGYGSYTSLRYFAFGTVALLLGVLTAKIWLSQPWIPAKLFKKLPIYGILVYLLAFIFVSFTGIDPALSFFSTFQRADGGFTLIFLVLFMLSVFTAITLGGERILYRFLKASVFGAALLSILIGFSYDGLGLLVNGIFERSRGGATIGNSSLAAFYAAWNVFFACILLVRVAGVKRKIGWGVSFVLILCSPLFLNWHVLFGSDPFTGITSLIGVARGAVLSLVIGFLFAVSTWLATDSKKSRAYLGRGLLVAMIAGLCWTGILLLQKSSALHRGFAEVASGARFIFWDSALAGFADRPVLGWGPNTFSEVYHRHFNADIFLPENSGEVLVDKPHNIFFETLAGGGLVLFSALCAYLAAIVYVLVRLSRRNRRLGALLLGSFVAWLIQMQFIFDSVASLALLFLVIGIGLTDDEVIDQARRPRAPLSAGGKTIMAFVIFVLCVLFVYAIFLPMRKAQVMFGVRNMTLPARADAWQSLSGISPMGDDYDSVITFARAYDTYKQNVQRLREGDPFQKTIALKELDAMSSYLLSLLRSRGEKYELMMVAAQMQHVRLLIDPNVPAQVWEDARRLIARIIEISPTDVRPHELLKFFEKMGR